MTRYLVRYRYKSEWLFLRPLDSDAKGSELERAAKEILPPDAKFVDIKPFPHGKYKPKVSGIGMPAYFMKPVMKRG